MRKRKAANWFTWLPGELVSMNPSVQYHIHARVTGPCRSTPLILIAYGAWNKLRAVLRSMMERHVKQLVRKYLYMSDIDPSKA